MNKVKNSMNKEDLKSSDKKDIKKNADKKFRIDYWAYFKIIFLLGIVIAIIYLLSRVMRKFLIIKGQVPEGAVIIVSQSLGPGKWLQVLNVFGKYLILGVSNDRINLLSEITDPKEIERLEVIINSKKAEEGHDFMDIVKDFFKTKLKNIKKVNKSNFDYEKDSLDFIRKQKERINKINNDDE